MTGDEAPDPEPDPWPVAAGIEIVDDEGLEAVSVRAVAARAGDTPMAVYRHAEDADALLRRVVRRVFEDWESQVYLALDEEEPMARLQRYAELYREYALWNPRRYALLFAQRHGIGTHAFPGDSGRRRPARSGSCRAPWARLLRRGRWRERPVEFALLFWSTVHGLVTLWRSGNFEDDDDFRAFYGRSLARLLRAMGGSTTEDRARKSEPAQDAAVAGGEEER